MELKIEQKNLPEPITFNYEEMKAELIKQAHDYETAVYSEQQIKQAKEDRSKLNALKRALNEERLKREREWMEPFQTFKNQINEIISIIDKPIGIIDRQIKEYDERQKAEKQDRIDVFFDNYKENNPCPEWLQSSDIFNLRWLNATCSEKTWQTEMVDRIRGILVDIETIQSLPDYSFEAMTVYKSSLDLAAALKEGKRLADIQKAKEAEQKAREQAEEAQKILADKVRGSHSAQEAEIEVFAQQIENDKAALEKGKNEGVRRWWVNIRACVTLEQSKDIKGYFEANGIEYTAQTERN